MANNELIEVTAVLKTDDISAAMAWSKRMEKDGWHFIEATTNSSDAYQSTHRGVITFSKLVPFDRKETVKM